MVKWAFDVFISRNNGKTRLYWRHKDGYRINIGEGEAKFWCSQKKGEGRSYSTKVSVYSFKRIRNHFDERNGIMDKSANTRNCINNVTTMASGTSATASYWPVCCISRTRLFQNQDKIDLVQSSISNNTATCESRYCPKERSMKHCHRQNESFEKPKCYDMYCT